MKKETFLNRTKGFAKNSNGYKNALNLMTTGEIVRTCYTTGSGRWTKNQDSTAHTINVLREAKIINDIDFKLKNDAPRGGSHGNYIELTAKGKRKIFTR